MGVNNSTLVVNKRSITVYDPAGRVEGRRMWSGYYAESHGILYVVEGRGESSAGARLEESQLVFSTVSSSMPNKPIAIFVNCPDLERRSEIGKLVTEVRRGAERRDHEGVINTTDYEGVVIQLVASLLALRTF